MVGKTGDSFLRVDLVRGRVGLLVRATRFVVGPVLTLAVLAAVVHQLARALLTRGDLTALRAVRSLQEHLVQRALHLCRGITFRGSIRSMCRVGGYRGTQRA